MLVFYLSISFFAIFLLTNLLRVFNNQTIIKSESNKYDFFGQLVISMIIFKWKFSENDIYKKNKRLSNFYSIIVLISLLGFVATISFLYFITISSNNVN
jgi:multisubunit Na+/H+ antiporter MnhF subunit